MRSFAFVEPTGLDEVIRLLTAGHHQARLIAGGSDLLGELKDEVVYYERLVSLAGVEELRHMRQEGGGLRLGAMITLAELEHDPRLQGPYRILNGMITNDKFCCTRWSELHLSWWRRPMRLRS